MRTTARMKNRTHIRIARPLAFLLLVAIFAALASLFFYPDSATYAQTETSETLETPALTATSTGMNTVELSWQAVTGAVRYELWAWDSVTGWQRLDDGSLTSAAYTHGGLAAGTTYWYAVRAVDAGGATSAWSDYASATVSAPQSQSSTPTPTPTASTQIAATLTPTSTPDSTPFAHAKPVLSAVAAAGAVELSWPAVTGAVRYELWAWDSVTGWQRLDDGSLTSAAYTHGGLAAGTTYWYAVRAVDAGGATSAWSEYAGATVSDTQMPALTVTPTPTSTSTLMPTPTPATTEKGALIALYQATGGANWTHNDNWLTDEPLSTWYGVTADRSGRVTTLNLESNNLTGQIPDLSALINLRLLNLRQNDLSGPIPELGALSNLTYLNLSFNNNLSGPIPELGALSNLTYLNLSFNNNLSGPVPDLSALSKLIQLYLRGIQLTGQISDLSLHANLQSLSLADNRLSGPIPDLSALSELTELYLSNNQLTGTIPTTLGNHPYLGELELSNNRLTGTIPAALGNLSLYSIYLSGNSLSGCIPASLRSVRRNDLEKLALPYCGAAPTATPTPGATPTPATTEKGALIALYQATGGANWKRNNNWLTDKPLDLWYGVTADSSGRVTALNLWQNQLRGLIPDLSALSNLTHLDLGQNELTGPIPDLDALSNLTELDFRHNRLSGQIPDLSALSNLDHLDLGFNRLTGQIPDLSALTNLRTLYLSHNRLTGQIPDLSALTNLRTLYLSHNRLTGQIPDLSALTNLRTLYLSHNRLSGPIPDLSALTNLTKMELGDGNELDGPIPDLDALTNLTYLNLNQNDLSGPIPDLSALSNLEYLSLSGNQLDGPIPDLSALSNLATLGLSDNRLTGPILNLNALTNLTYLNLRQNDLSGPVPDLSALTNLRGLDLSGNQLCLSAGYDLSGSSAVVTEHLNLLNLPTCTDADLAAAPAAPQNLTATVGDGQVILTWDAVAAAAGYDLWVWDSIDRQFGPIGGALTSRSYTHAVRQDGRNYYYQVRARNANGVRGEWSKRVQAIVVPQQFLPPPQSLGLELFYQKYLEVGGLHVVAPSEVSDTKMVQTREIITGMLSARSDLLQAMADNGTLIAIRPGLRGGFANKSSSSAGFTLGAHVPEVDGNCSVFIHEFAHLIHFVLEELPGGDAFNLRLQAAYQAALTAGLWDEEYASTVAAEYWAETVTFWFQDSVLHSSPAVGLLKLKEHDPEVARLIEDTLGDATVPWYCKP